MPVAVVTGASSGIGKAAAIRLAREGFSVSLSGRKEDALKETADECIKAGLKQDQVVLNVGDLTDFDAAKKLIENTLAKLNTIDTLINSAGILTNGEVNSTDIEVYDKQMDVNVRSVIYLTKLALPHIIKSKGNVVNVSSIAGPCPFPGVTYYSISKAALDQFTKCLALEMAPHGVRVNSVNPGVIVTDIHKRAGMGDKDYEAFLEKCKSTHALGRAGDVDEVSEAILFLATSRSSFTTGELLRVDGGRGIMFPR
ncbi:unnamed protein product [Caenorhabditis auriculariae]|uniref:Uncharacterized protein n=1 Tax=Caenorhabditis auriculariae TaxID=2777116 RepID=A0A8S1H0L6_9PELO|nr:unnamed protein product [Caenorhabditis auriculariae]